MAKFEQSHPHHEVHEIHRPQGHGLAHDRLEKGNRSPAVGSTPAVDYGTVPGMGGAGSPGVPSDGYGSDSVTGS